MHHVRIYNILPLCLLLLAVADIYAQEKKSIFTITRGTIQFKSEAPLEIIQASSDELKGLIDFKQGTFAFSIPVNTFKGFNSALQQEHFNENYLETIRFPKATFSGRLIEDIDGSKAGEYSVRAKGELLIHGVKQERIISCTVKISSPGIEIDSKFQVLLEDHNITIPKVVEYKIAETINVTISAKGIIK